MTIDSIHGDYDCTLGLSCIMSRDKGTFPLHPIVLHTYSTHAVWRKGGLFWLLLYCQPMYARRE